MVARTGPNWAVPAATAPVGVSGAVALLTYRLAAAFFLRKSDCAVLLLTYTLAAR